MILDQVVQRIRDEWGQSQLSPELLRRIDGILDVNSVEHRVVAHCYREFNYCKTDILTTLLWRPTLLPQSLDNIPNQGDKQSFKPLFPPHYLPGIPLLHKVGAAANRTNPTSIDCEPNQVIFGPVCISFYTQTTMNEE